MAKRPRKPKTAMPYTAFGREIRRRRRSKGLSQPKLAELLSGNLADGGIHPDTVGTWERGKAFPTPAHLHALREKLDFKESEIYALTSSNDQQASPSIAVARPIPKQSEQAEDIVTKLKESRASNDPLAGIAAIKSFQIALRKRRSSLADDGFLKHLVEIQTSLLKDVGSAHGFVEYSGIIGEFLKRNATDGTKADFLTNAHGARDVLFQHYADLDQPLLAAGSELELAGLIADLDKDECDRALKRFSDHSASGRDKQRDIRLSSFLQTFPNFLNTLHYLSNNLHGTYPALEAARVLKDCGIGPHRLGLRSYLHELRGELQDRGNVHDECIVCTSTAIEVFRGAREPGVVEAIEWLEQQRVCDWRGRRYADGTLALLGYNYTAAAMKALHVAGRLEVAQQIGELLLARFRTDSNTRDVFWDGVDVEPHVATGRVLEALQVRGALPRAISLAACRFIHSKLQPLHIRRLTREYDTWSLIGLARCEGARGAPQAAGFFKSLLSAEIWESNGSWSQNLYRTAMVARLIIEAIENQWMPHINGGKL